LMPKEMMLGAQNPRERRLGSVCSVVSTPVRFPPVGRLSNGRGVLMSPTGRDALDIAAGRLGVSIGLQGESTGDAWHGGEESSCPISASDYSDNPSQQRVNSPWTRTIHSIHFSTMLRYINTNGTAQSSATSTEPSLSIGTLSIPIEDDDNASETPVTSTPSVPSLHLNPSVRFTVNWNVLRFHGLLLRGVGYRI
jgi:hypothetical protein